MTAAAQDIAERSPVHGKPEPQPPADLTWSPATRVAFRFCFIYFGLYILTTQLLGAILANPVLGIPVLAREVPMRPLVLWVGAHFLGAMPAVNQTSSSDTLFDWTHAFTLLLLAASGTVVWSLRARAASYPRLYTWFRLLMRVGLGATLFAYGFLKVFLLQMPTVFLSRLLEPFGDFSPLSVLWVSVGAAPAYQCVLGLAEVLGGLLLLLPWTGLIGALVTLGVAFGVFVVNMSYDVDVKLYSLHLVLMALVLIAPDARRLIDWFVLNRPVVPAPRARYGRESTHRRWIMAQVAFTVWAIGLKTVGAVQVYNAVGPAAPRSPLFGIWDVDSMSIDGQLRPPLTTDGLRYSHVVFQAIGSPITFQKMDQSFDHFFGTVDPEQRTITFTGGTDNTWRPRLTYEQPSPTRLTLEGERRGQHVRITMALHDLNAFPVISRGFNWVQEFPFGR
jgi:hypothetical protein